MCGWQCRLGSQRDCDQVDQRFGVSAMYHPLRRGSSYQRARDLARGQRQADVARQTQRHVGGHQVPPLLDDDRSTTDQALVCEVQVQGDVGSAEAVHPRDSIQRVSGSFGHKTPGNARVMRHHR